MATLYTLFDTYLPDTWDWPLWLSLAVPTVCALIGIGLALWVLRGILREQAQEREQMLSAHQARIQALEERRRKAESFEARRLTRKGA